MQHALLAHPAYPSSAVTTIEVSAQLSDGVLALHFTMHGDLDRVRWADETDPRRTDLLWDHTVFEAFVQEAGSADYREFNAAVSGAWAAYDFVTGLARTDADDAFVPRIQAQRSDERADIEVLIPVEATSVWVGVTAVIEGADGELSYWALAHANEQLNFHDVSTWTLELTSRTA